MSALAAVMVGNLSDGFKFYGPFPGMNGALVWSQPQGSHDQYAVTLEKPKGPDQNYDPDASHILCVGEPTNGFKFIGPFVDFDAADEYSHEYHGGDPFTWIAPLQRPE